MYPTFQARRATYGSLGCEPQVTMPPRILSPEGDITRIPCYHMSPSGLESLETLYPGVYTPGYHMSPYRAQILRISGPEGDTNV